MAAGDGIRCALHLCGRDHLPLPNPRLTLVRRLVYAADQVAALPKEGTEAIAAGALVLLHSPRASKTFASLVDAAGLQRGSIAIAALGEAVLRAAGPGWRSAAAAGAPRDEALLELAAKLCKTEPESATGNSDER
jgi:uroporphyrinogen-III synthase